MTQNTNLKEGSFATVKFPRTHELHFLNDERVIIESIEGNLAKIKFENSTFKNISIDLSYLQEDNLILNSFSFLNKKAKRQGSNQNYINESLGHLSTKEIIDNHLEHPEVEKELKKRKIPYTKGEDGKIKTDYLNKLKWGYRMHSDSDRPDTFGT